MRLAEIESREQMKQARHERRSWFVLGRLLTQAALKDQAWAEVLQALARQDGLAQTERRLLQRLGSQTKDRALARDLGATGRNA